MHCRDVGKHERIRPLGRRTCTRELNITTSRKGIVLEYVDCIRLAQDKDQRWVVMNTVMKC
jgi:hypothetical protein